MKQPPKIIIALFARGREIGYAVLEGGELTRYGVKTIRGRRKGAAFQRTVEATASSLLADASKDAVNVFEKHDARTRLGGLAQALSRYAERWEGRTLLLSTAQAKAALCGTRKATHAALASATAERYPIIEMGKPPQRHAAMAVAFADAAWRRFETHRGGTRQTTRVA